MSSLAQVAIHKSQFPEAVRRDLLDSLRTRQVSHKFHYDSVRQTQKWLALHQACSPSRADADCAAIYDRGFQAVVAHVSASRARLIGLGCGGGQKDSRLLKLLRDADREISYMPVDVSAAMVLVAREAATAIIPEENCAPLVCDLAKAEDLPAVLDDSSPSEAARVLTFLGMLPNFEPEIILPRLAALVRPTDCLLLSANLAPGPDYLAGVQQILPLYDNGLTRDWLMTFLLDLGFEKDDGELRFGIEGDSARDGLKRVTAYFRLSRPRAIPLDDERFEFHAGESIRLFYSYRHTPGLVRELLARHQLEILDQWIARSEEEGVFLARRAR